MQENDYFLCFEPKHTKKEYSDTRIKNENKFLFQPTSCNKAQKQYKKRNK